MPKDEPMAANPPDGAIIDYVVPAQVHGPVQLAILDAQAQTVRRFSSDKIRRPATSQTQDRAGMDRKTGAAAYVSRASIASSGICTTKRLRDCQEESAKRKGVWAPPGRYTVVLTVIGAETFGKPLELKPDPRVQCDAGDYRARICSGATDRERRAWNCARLRDGSKRCTRS